VAHRLDAVLERGAGHPGRRSSSLECRVIA